MLAQGAGQIRPGRQTSTILTAEKSLDPYQVVPTDVQSLGMDAGDFDLVVSIHAVEELGQFTRAQRR